MSNTTRTIQAGVSDEWVTQLFDGTWQGDDEGFPLLQVSAYVGPGDWDFVIHKGHVVGRCRISEVRLTDQTAQVGTEGVPGDARCWLVVHLCGERAPGLIQRRGHQGIRYDDVREGEQLVHSATRLES
jgi:hypothetical protein